MIPQDLPLSQSAADTVDTVETRAGVDAATVHPPIGACGAADPASRHEGVAAVPGPTATLAVGATRRAVVVRAGVALG